MGTIYNLAGTSFNSFKISKFGPTLYQGASLPNDLNGADGDIYVQAGASQGIFQKINGSWQIIYVSNISDLNYVFNTSIIINTSHTIINEQIVIMKNSSVRTVYLPLSPTIGQSHIIKDGSGNAFTNHITIDGNGNNIDGGLTYLMTEDYQSIQIVYDGTSWNII